MRILYKIFQALIAVLVSVVVGGYSYAAFMDKLTTPENALLLQDFADSTFLFLIVLSFFYLSIHLIDYFVEWKSWNKLIRDIKTVGNGDLHHRASVKGGNMIGIIATEFNKTILSIQKSIKKLETSENALAHDAINNEKVISDLQVAMLNVLDDAKHDKADAQRINLLSKKTAPSHKVRRKVKKSKKP